jgi:lipopolysaccharide/colanic/teichoic acid biosynthesis glycosyltransferase
MAKRLFDILAAAVGLLLLIPVFAAAACFVYCSDPGPVLYRARRCGAGGRPFTMFKFRTMRVAPQQGSVITAHRDSRVFFAGRVLRALKIDELPQLWNVLLGDMSIVGPRPEDPLIVEQHYGPLGMETLQVPPGLSSPGSLYYYTHGEQHVSADDPVRAYVQSLLPIKLALDLLYVRRHSLAGDLKVILRTAIVIALIAAGRRRFADPADLPAARQMVASQPERLVLGSVISNQ